MPRINPTVNDKALEIYNKIKREDKKQFISEAIIEKWEKENGEVFSAEQIEWLNKNFRRKE